MRNYLALWNSGKVRVCMMRVAAHSLEEAKWIAYKTSTFTPGDGRRLAVFPL